MSKQMGDFLEHQQFKLHGTAARAECLKSGWPSHHTVHRKLDAGLVTVLARHAARWSNYRLMPGLGRGLAAEGIMHTHPIARRRFHQMICGD